MAKRRTVATERPSGAYAANLTDSWTPEQRETFVRDWQNDEPLRQWMNEPMAQSGRGQKRSIDDVNDGASTSEAQKRCYEDGGGESQNDEPSSSQTGRGEKRSHDEMSDEPNDKVGNFVTLTGVKQVNVKKFRTTGVDYTFRFTDSFASQELSQYHNRLHEIFQNVLDTITRDVPEHDQTRFVLRSPQLETPISLPFMSRERLTTERVLSEIERIVQSNHEFRLNDSVDVNLIHVEMPHGGKGTKRCEINLEKHLTKKRSIIRIQNKDELCLARALVVAKAKIDDDGQYKSIVDHRRPLQTRIAQELHQKAGRPPRTLWTGRSQTVSNLSLRLPDQHRVQRTPECHPLFRSRTRETNLPLSPRQPLRSRQSFR